jgi:hypothetical protein
MQPVDAVADEDEQLAVEEVQRLLVGVDVRCEPAAGMEGAG